MRTVVGATGRVLITVGLLILLFVAYQLWGTGFWEARAQSDLEHKFQRELDRSESTPTTTNAPTTSAPATTTAPATPVPAAGDPVGVIKIDKIGVDKVVVEGTSVPDLRMGPGHYAGSPLPGQRGNVAIAGHRTTYGAPFGNLDQLSGPKPATPTAPATPGDRVSVQTLTGTWTYELTEDPFAVSPNQVEVLEPTPDPNPDQAGQPLPTLTLTTCNPRYSASQRLIVKARLINNLTPLPSPDGQPRLVLDTGLSGGDGSLWPPEWSVILWGLAAAAVGGLWWLVFHRYPRWTTWVGGVIPFLVVLFVFYTYLERVLPNNY